MKKRPLSEDTQSLLREAYALAREMGHSYVGTEHLMLAMLRREQLAACRVLTRTGWEAESFRSLLLSQTGRGSRRVPLLQGLSPRAKKTLRQAGWEAAMLNMERIEPEHLLLALTREERCTAACILLGGGTDLNCVFSDAYSSLRLPRPVQNDRRETTTKLLELYCENMLEKASRSDPVIGREKEISAVLQILCRKNKNNPALIGEPGVGKTAIVEGLAQRIAAGNVPEPLRTKRLFCLNMASVLAGTKYRGEFEERVRDILAEIRRCGNIILFVDEMHTLVGAGSAEGAIDAANLLKPALGRSELQMIGATTLAEYRKYIEKDAALERRFQTVLVQEPTVEDTIAILRGLESRYEVFHGVKITDNAIIAAATLSNRYITDRYLPDKAIDLIDEACAMIRTEMDSMPTELDVINRKIIQMEIEEAALKNEEDELSKGRLAELQKELADQREKFSTMKAQWENEKNAIGRVQQLRERIESLNREIEAAQQNYDLEKAAKLMYGDLPEAKKQLEHEEKLAQSSKESSLLRNKVTEEEIARIIERWTGIPTSRLMEGEREKLLRLPEILHKRVIGQDEAVQCVSDAILRSRAGIQDPNRPLGSFLFLGPTGVGKTELAKTLAEALFDDEKNLVRIDMSEYMEKFSVSRLIGAPPGYVGYEEGGQLTEAVRRRPYSVILFDEIEKAHPDVFNVLLQVLDDGRITDSQGRTVDFKNTIIILTSNLGSQQLLDGIGPDGEITQSAKDAVEALLHHTFRPEFLNRLDEIVFYKPLTKENITGIIDLQIAALNKRLADKQLRCELTPAAKQYVIDAAYDPQFGARPLRRYVQHTVETLLAKKIVEGNIQPGAKITVDVENGELALR